MSAVKLKDYVFAGYPAIIVNTSEELRALDSCLNVAKATNAEVYVWSVTKGIQKYELKQERNKKPEPKVKTIDEDIPPDESVLKKGMELNKDGNYIFCLLDFHPYIKSPIVLRTAKDVFAQAKEKYVTYVFISSTFEVPKELEHEVISINLELPTKEDFKELISELTDENRRYQGLSEDDKEKASNAVLGLTLFEAENTFSTALSKTDSLDLDVINDVKSQIICKGGLIEYQKSDESLETIGGMHVFTDYAIKRSSAYSKQAQAYGLPYPKGVLLVGIPGCGKSLAAKALANMWHEPLIKLDLGKLFGSYVGDTESNTRKALQIAEAMAPCVLLIDEIDKGLSGVSGGGKNDSGVTSRMFGTILTWMQDKTKPVYVIATANDITSLPSELLRKGRFDEIFFVDLPSLEERKEIFAIQIKKRGRKIEDYNIDTLAENSDGYNGAEIEGAIKDAMVVAFNDNIRPFTTEDILDAMSVMNPASHGIMKETVERLHLWSESHGIRSANSQPKNSTQQVRSPKTTRGIRSQKA